MNRSFVKLGMVAILALSSLGLTACSDEQIALGAGVIIGAAISDDGPHHDHYYPRPYHPPRPYPGHYPGRGHHYGYAGELQVSLPGVTAQPQTDVEKAAAHFAISEEAAAKVLAALEAAKKQDFSELTKLGFSRDDMKAMADGQNPRVSTLQTASEVLGLDLDQTHDVIQTMKADLAAGL